MPTITPIHAHSPAWQHDQVDDLTAEAFGFTFAAWRAQGWWAAAGADYTGYGVFENGRLSAYAAAYRLDLLVHGRPFEAVQVGAVATRKTRHGAGLSRAVLEHILALWPDTPTFLCANDSVLDFYPRFGFRPLPARQVLLPLEPDAAGASAEIGVIPAAEGANYGNLPGSAPELGQPLQPGGAPAPPVHLPGACRLDPRHPRAAQFLRGRAAFSGILDCANAAPINAFHLLSEPDLWIHEISTFNALLVTDRQGDCLHLFDVIAPRPLDFRRLLPYLAASGARSLRCWFNPDWLGAPPAWSDPFEDPHLFVRGDWSRLTGPFALPYLLTT